MPCISDINTSGVITNPSTADRNLVTIGTSTVVGLSIRAATGQTANIFESINSAGTVRTRIDNLGNLHATTGTINNLNSEVISITQTNSAVQCLVITAASGQSANTLTINDSLGNMIGGFDKAGNFSVQKSSGQSAKVHIAGGSTSAGTAPLKLTSGTNMTAVEAGAMEYDGSKLFFSPTSSIRLPLHETEASNSFSGNQNDMNLGTSSYLRLTADASGREITGISGGWAGRRIRIQNLSSTTYFILKNQSASSTAANRIISANGSSDIPVYQDSTVSLTYDATTARWREDMPREVLFSNRSVLFTGGTFEVPSFQTLKVWDEALQIYNDNSGFSILWDNNALQSDITLYGERLLQRGEQVEAISAPTGDLPINDAVTLLSLDPSGAGLTLSGIAGGTSGRILYVANIGADDITILEEDAGSDAANRIVFGAFFGGTLKTNWSISMVYCAAANGYEGRWLVS